METQMESPSLGWGAMMKFRLSRWLMLPLLAAVLSVSLVGCTARPSDEELTARFSGLNGIASVETHCNQPLPWNWDCQLSMVLKPKVSTADLTKIIKATGELRLRVGNSPKPLKTGELSMDIQNPSDVDAAELARAYVLAEARQDLGSFRVDRYFPVGGRSYSVELGLSPASGFKPLVEMVSALVDNAAFTKVFVSSSGFEITALDHRVPTAGISLLEQVAKKYPVIGGKINAETVEVRLPSSANRTAAIAFASTLPQYSKIGQVYLENNPIISRSNIAPESAAGLEGLIDLLRNQPELKAIEARVSALNITLKNLDQLQKIDKLLSTHSAYQQTQISYRLDRSTLFKPANGPVQLTPFIELLKDGRFESVLIGVSKQGGLNVTVRTTENLSAYELGKLLALSGLGDPVAQISVRVSPKGQGDSWNLAFSTADPGQIPDRKNVDANRIKELASGWQAGKDLLGK